MGHNYDKNVLRVTCLLAWVFLFIVNNYSEFQVNIFSYDRDIRKYQSFLHDADDCEADDDGSMTIPRLFLRKQPS